MKKEDWREMTILHQTQCWFLGKGFMWRKTMKQMWDVGNMEKIEHIKYKCPNGGASKKGSNSNANNVYLTVREDDLLYRISSWHFRCHGKGRVIASGLTHGHWCKLWCEIPHCLCIFRADCMKYFTFLREFNFTLMIFFPFFVNIFSLSIIFNKLYFIILVIVLSHIALYYM